MKKIILASAIAALASTSAFSEGNMSVETNPLGFAFGLFNGTFLYDVSEKLTVGPKVSYWGFDLGDDSVSWLRAGVRADFMPDGVKQSGLYVGTDVDYTVVSADTESEGVTCDASLDAFGASATGGYKFISQGGFVAKIGVGYGFSFAGEFEGSCSDDTDYANDSTIPFGGGMKLEGALGYKF